MSERVKRVLIVDDEPWNLEVLESYLLETGCNVTKASDGEAALAEVGRRAPDIVLLDVMMPGMDGFEVCRGIKESDDTRFLPVVMVTSLDQKADRIKAVLAGADDFITKPVDKVELLARVKSLLRVKSLHDELERRYREVLELKALQENMVNMLVHDFRNPLTGVLGYLELIGHQSETGACGDSLQFVNNSRYLVKKMCGMVSDLLDLARLEKNVLPLKLESIHLKDVVEENLKEFQHQLEEKKLCAEIKEEIKGVYANADETLLKRVVGNILANACRHSPEGGRITFIIKAGGGTVSLTVSDEGPGIPEDLLGRVFDKFYQVEARASDPRSGAGLGLAFCEMVVRAHGGSIEAENNPDKGCRFIISLPSFIP